MRRSTIAGLSLAVLAGGFAVGTTAEAAPTCVGPVAGAEACVGTYDGNVSGADAGAGNGSVGVYAHRLEQGRSDSAGVLVYTPDGWTALDHTDDGRGNVSWKANVVGPSHHIWWSQSAGGCYLAVTVGGRAQPVPCPTPPPTLP